MKIDAKLGLDVFKLDKEPHIVIDTEVCRTVCKDEACMYVCPADLYEKDDQGRMTVNWEGCLECGTCMICCETFVKEPSAVLLAEEASGGRCGGRRGERAERDGDARSV